MAGDSRIAAAELDSAICFDAFGAAGWLVVMTFGFGSFEAFVELLTGLTFLSGFVVGRSSVGIGS